MFFDQYLHIIKVSRPKNTNEKSFTMYLVSGATIEKNKKEHRLHRVLKTGSSGK